MSTMHTDLRTRLLRLSQLPGGEMLSWEYRDEQAPHLRTIAEVALALETARERLAALADLARTRPADEQVNPFAEPDVSALKWGELLDDLTGGRWALDMLRAVLDSHFGPDIERAREEAGGDDDDEEDEEDGGDGDGPDDDPPDEPDQPDDPELVTVGPRGEFSTN